jgi:hypothetical protein
MVLRVCQVGGGISILVRALADLHLALSPLSFSGAHP